MPLTAPKQPRSKKTLDRLVSAGIALLREGGPEAVTVKAVVARARASVGSFYARFDGKEDLLAYLQAHLQETTAAAWEGRLESHSWSRREIGPVARSVVDLIVEMRERWSSDLDPACRLSAAREEHDPTRRQMMDQIVDRLLTASDEITHEDPRLAARIGVGAVLGALEHGRADSTKPPSEELRAECTQLLVGYLTGTAREPSGPVDYFDAWS